MSSVGLRMERRVLRYVIGGLVEEDVLHPPLRLVAVTRAGAAVRLGLLLDLGLDALDLALDALRLLLGVGGYARDLARHAARLRLDAVDRAVDVAAVVVVVAAAASRRDAGDRQRAGNGTGRD